MARARQVETDAQRAKRLFEMMTTYIREHSDAERDRSMQIFLAQAKTPRERFRTLCILMNAQIRQSKLTGRDGS